MTKQETIRLFQQLFETPSRTRANWVSMIDSLEKEGEITASQATWRRNAWLGDGRLNIIGAAK